MLSTCPEHFFKERGREGVPEGKEGRKGERKGGREGERKIRTGTDSSFHRKALPLGLQSFQGFKLPLDHKNFNSSHDFLICLIASLLNVEITCFFRKLLYLS